MKSERMATPSVLFVVVIGFVARSKGSCNRLAGKRVEKDNPAAFDVAHIARGQSRPVLQRGGGL